MFLKRCYRRVEGKRYAYWALVESHRTERGPRQRVVAYLGEMDEAGRLGVKRAADGKGFQPELFGEAVEPEWVEVDAKRIRLETRACSAGCGWVWSSRGSWGWTSSWGALSRRAGRGRRGRSRR